jgi:hypothetical protein
MVSCLKLPPKGLKGTPEKVQRNEEKRMSGCGHLKKLKNFISPQT